MSRFGSKRRRPSRRISRAFCTRKRWPVGRVLSGWIAAVREVSSTLPSCRRLAKRAPFSLSGKKALMAVMGRGLLDQEVCSRRPSSTVSSEASPCRWRLPPSSRRSLNRWIPFWGRQWPERARGKRSLPLISAAGDCREKSSPQRRSLKSIPSLKEPELSRRREVCPEAVREGADAGKKAVMSPASRSARLKVAWIEVLRQLSRSAGRPMVPVIDRSAAFPS